MGADCDIAECSLQRGIGSEEEERFLSAQADAFAGAKAEEESRPAPFEMTGEGPRKGTMYRAPTKRNGRHTEVRRPFCIFVK